MSVSQLSSTDLCRALAGGWTEERPDLPRELIARLGKRWEAPLAMERSGASAYRAVFDAHRVRLRGASQLGCLILSRDAAVEQEVSTFWDNHGEGGRLAVIIAATPSLKDTVRQLTSERTCVVLESDEIRALLYDKQPVEVLKEHIRGQIPAHGLLPYDITHPAAPNMFFGRRDVLNRLHHEETTNFAIAGPPRIGKSSLLQQYRHELIRNSSSRKHRVHLIDCYEFWNLSDDELARSLAMAVSRDSHANDVKVSTLQKFLKFHYNQRNKEKPLELLLDEVDGVCESATFDALADAMRNELCRVVLCGKARLYGMMTKRKSHFARRLELIRPEPLDPESAGRLLFEPLNDMKIAPQDIQVTQEIIFSLTARRPHLIHESARILFQMVEASATRTITHAHLELLKDRFFERAHAMLPLESMIDDHTRLLTLVWLRDGGRPITVGFLQALAESQGIKLAASHALDILDDLWICNVLTWERGSLTLANHMLVEFVQKMDFEREIAELRRTILGREFAAR